jgi:predicted AlkP superfamily phosphohydrolase/phosphomutase
MPSRRKVLAVGVDAADSRLVLDLIDRGELPTLRRLRDEGSWASVRSPTDIGSGTVWPTFYTGTQPDLHGVYGEWSWKPDAMNVITPALGRLDPFWRSFEDEGLTVGVLDVPLSPHVGLSRGFEVTEWGGHDAVWDRPAISPREIVPAVGVDHPFGGGRLQVREHDRVKVGALAAGCIEGATLRGELAAHLLESARPDLAIVVFGEVHRAAHHLWHTVEPDDPLYDDLPAEESNGTPGLVDVYREVDRQIGHLADAIGEDAPLAVFSLHGMCPTRGVALSLLGDALRELGFAQPARRGGRTALAAVKRRTPSALKRVYYRRAPNAVRYRLAAPTMMAPLDWSRTRAFALPTDQHGWVRVNLQGREAEGTVAPEDYESTCEELEDALRGLCTEDGRPIASNVIRAHPGGPPPPLLPDLVVHWSDAAFDRPVRLRDPAVEAWPTAGRTGHHRSGGFFIARGLNRPPGEELEAAELHRVLRGACRG